MSVKAQSIGLLVLVPATVYGGQGLPFYLQTSVIPATIAVTGDKPCIVKTTFTYDNGDGNYTLPTKSVSVKTSVTLTFTATAAGDTQTVTATLTVLPPLLVGLNVGPGAGGSVHFIQSNTSPQGTITINTPAPTGGLAVTLGESANPQLVNIPSTVTIPAGATQGTFPVTVPSTDQLSLINLDASSNGQTITEQLYVLPGAPLPSGYSAGIFLGGPFGGTALNTVNGGGTTYDYVWVIAQTFPNGNVWVSTYYSNKATGGSWETIKGYLQSSAAGGNTPNGVSLLTGVIDNQGTIMPNLMGTIGVNNGNGPDPFEFLSGGVLTNSANTLSFSSQGNSAGAAPLQGSIVFTSSGLTLNLSTLSGAVTGGAGSLAISFAAPQPVGTFVLKKVS